MSVHEQSTDRLYPYELAIGNAILALLAVAAIFDNKATGLGYRILMAALLVAAGFALAKRTEQTGYTPTRLRTSRLSDDQRNMAGWTTVVLVTADAILAPAMFFS